VKGKVYLVGAGPGDPDLLTIKAVKLLRCADAVLHDDLVSPQILELASPAAQLYKVGKRCGVKKITQEEIHFLLITLASSGFQVVRLKSGDPLIFGRAGEEIDALRRSNIDFEIVPGVTAALGAAAAAAIPLTHRRVSHAVVFLTGRLADGENPDWMRLASSGATFVVYMPGRNYAAIASRLRAAGLAAETPCAIVSHLGRTGQQVELRTLQQLAHTTPLPAPTLLIVGEVVRFAPRDSFSREYSERSQLAPWLASAEIQALFLQAQGLASDKE